MENNQKIIQEDEIDLRELFLTLWKKKVFIVLLTFIVTVSSILYINSTFAHKTKLFFGVSTDNSDKVLQFF